MVMKRFWLGLLALLVSGVASAAGATEVKISVARPGASATVDQMIRDGKALVSVVDAGKAPLLGLGVADFSVTQAGRSAKVTSVQPLAESMDVPRHLVLVLDNSFSMEERKAIPALLGGVNELLKTMRPIDDVQVVVFNTSNPVTMGGRKLRVETFKSNQSAELHDFVTKAYGRKTVTGKTVLYEAMLAGIELIKKMPVTEPRFMVVFSDGEDLNSSYKREDVLKAAQGLKRFNAYAIDYLESAATDKFLTRFVSQNNGQIWKAKSEANLVPIFQSVASKMLHYYVVNYQFPPTGKLTATPASLTIDEVRTMGAAPTTRIDVASLTLRPVVDSASGIARWKVVVSNTKGTVVELAGEGAPVQDLQLPLPVTDLPSLAAGGDLAVKMELEDRSGQSLVLTAPAVKVKSVQTRANLAVAPTSLTIEEIRTIDVSPMLGHLYFSKDSSEISPRYVLFSGAAETAGFDEQKFSGTLDKYYQDLNIIGKRLADTPAATVTLIGCNDNTGKEKGNKKLSARRAEAVRNYLQTVWNIAPERMKIEVRNLPAKPSSITLREGQEENRRVEIVSTDPTILAPIRSTYVTTKIDSPGLTLRPDVVAPHGIASWQITAANASGSLADLKGKGAPAKEAVIKLPAKDLKALGTGGDIAVKMELQDSKGQNLLLSPAPVKVNFIQTSQRLAAKQDLLVQEKYALILFDFDKDALGPQNQEIVNRVVARIKTLPQAKVEIVGHTDNIGKEKYNMKLSERRALAVYKLLAAAYGEAAKDRIRYAGVGPNTPLFDNLSPEARAFNRTVTITLEYLSAE